MTSGSRSSDHFGHRFHAGRRHLGVPQPSGVLKRTRIRIQLNTTRSAQSGAAYTALGVHRAATIKRTSVTIQKIGIFFICKSSANARAVGQSAVDLSSATRPSEAAVNSK
ncbi:hypothetical protein EVAR_33327_1 [Eumeta japonica]|uniref:Uncharacterized protein n=1 Tax=Eumeta variegata TaxID=151549 RepID=A0A4C1WF26_EUMVA|nr:hypothetical protein EVAR_33327_1 [Eumeta japonica]